MRIIVTHQSCDLDGISSIWLIKKFLPGWENAELRFVLAGDRLSGNYQSRGDAIEIIDDIETIHVDTGMGALDHHQTQDREVCAASITLDFVKDSPHNTLTANKHRTAAVERMIQLVVDVDQFQEVYYESPLADIYEFTLMGIIDGFKMLNPGEDIKTAEFVMQCLDDILHNFENRIWAEEEIKEKGREFETRWGKALALETQNDDVLKLAQKMGYVVVIRKDPHNGKLRIKARPMIRQKYADSSHKTDYKEVDVDLTPVYEKLRVMDTQASWFLHVSNRMLLNGSSKNTTMKGTTVTLDEAIDVLKNV